MNKLMNSLRNFNRLCSDKPLSYFKYIADKIPTHEFTKSINLRNDIVYSCGDCSISIVKLNKLEKGHLYEYKKGSSLFKPLIGNMEIKHLDKNMNQIKKKPLKREFNYVDPTHYYQIINKSEHKSYSIQIYKPSII